MNTHKPCLPILLILLLTLLLAACGSSVRGKTQPSEAIDPMIVEMPVSATEAPAVALYDPQQRVVEQPAAVEAFGSQAPAQGAYPAPAVTVDGGVGGSGEAPAGNPNPAQPPVAGTGGGGMLIKDAALELLVADTDLALNRVTQLAADRGGYIISSQSTMVEGYKQALLRLGIPSQAFEATLNELRELGVQVLNESASGQDVSAEYTDLRSRLANLEATAARVRQFLETATTVEESLRINATLSELEGQIEQVKGQMRYYEGRAAYSTITVSLTPQRPTPTPLPTTTPTPTPTPAAAWDPGDTFDQASGVLVQLSQAAVDVLIWAAMLVGPLAILGGLGWLILRGLRRLGPGRRPAIETPPTAGRE